MATMTAAQARVQQKAPHANLNALAVRPLRRSGASQREDVNLVIVDLSSLTGSDVIVTTRGKALANENS
jgi:hypothetical protein